jgi:hypothetical protein
MTSSGVDFCRKTRTVPIRRARGRVEDLLCCIKPSRYHAEGGKPLLVQVTIVLVVDEELGCSSVWSGSGVPVLGVGLQCQ